LDLAGRRRVLRCSGQQLLWLVLHHICLLCRIRLLLQSVAGAFLSIITELLACSHSSLRHLRSWKSAYYQIADGSAERHRRSRKALDYLEHTDDVCVDLVACHGAYGRACMA